MVEQSEDALEAPFSRGRQPAKVTDALQPFGQNVLQETVDKALRGQAQGAGGVGGALAISEGDVRAAVGEDAFGAEGGAVNVGG